MDVYFCRFSVSSSSYVIVISTFNVKVPSKTGSTTEKKEVLLEDHDPIWLELRDSHIADVSFVTQIGDYYFMMMEDAFTAQSVIWQASERLHEKMTNFIAKNKAAQIHSSR